MKKKTRLIILSLLFFVAFILFTFIVRQGYLNQFDFNTTVRLQDNIPKKFDGLFSSLSLLGSFEILVGLLFIIFVFRKKLISLLVFIPFTVAHLIEISGKYFLYHAGPPHRFFRYNIDFLFPSSSIQPGSSYPSGHSLRVVFISIIIAYLINKSRASKTNKIIFNFLLFSFNGVMLVSRISLGEHWTSDVIGGVLLGLSSGIFSLIFL
jgi:membrane-associated phospholipid phosphatase